MFTYERSSGIMRHDGIAIGGPGYSGHGVGLNNPAMSDVKDVGPLPAGLYLICVFVDHPIVGQLAAELIPHSDNEMFGRSGFFIHGDNAAMDHTASDGCIILARGQRELIAAAPAGDNVLEVY